MIPQPIIIISFIVAFIMLAIQYYMIDPRRRVLNLRFVLMVGAIMAAIGYPVGDYIQPGGPQLSWIFGGLALFWLLLSYYLLRRMPPRDHY
jgi:hypothetical protein